MTPIHEAMLRMGQRAKDASRVLALASEKQKNAALSAISQTLRTHAQEILDANAIDISRGEQSGMSPALLDRLRLTPSRIDSMASGVLDVIGLPDPVGRVLDRYEHPNGMQIEKVSVPLGVIAVIFEARPNVTSDAAALCLKSGNAVILRGGKEAIYSNSKICALMRQAVVSVGLPEDVVSLVADTSRESAQELMRLNGLIDVLIPRGGAGLIRACVQNATVPVIETGAGNCHIYIDQSADIEMAAQIVLNAKTSRPSVCNAAESLLLHEAIAETALPYIARLLEEKNVILHGDARSCALAPQILPATEEDWATEYLDYQMSVKIVSDLNEAIAHINRYSTMHSECIVTRDDAAARQFLDQIDSAAVYVNASTRFTDGGEFGFGAEIGISTQKLHARGPIGLPELNSYKYKIHGNGQVR